MDILQPQPPPHGVEFVDEALHAVEGEVARPPAAAAAQLVEHHDAAVPGERFVVQETARRAARSAVDHQERRPGAAAFDTVIDGTSGDIDEALAGLRAERGSAAREEPPASDHGVQASTDQRVNRCSAREGK